MRRQIRFRTREARLAFILGCTALISVLLMLIFLYWTKDVRPEADPEKQEVEKTVDQWTSSVSNQLWLVNEDHKLPVSYVPKSLATLEGSNVQVVQEAAEAFKRMTDDMENPVVPANGYISAEAQQNLYEAKLQEYIDEGYLPERAELKIMEDYRPGGLDEHQIGLTIDVCADDSLTLDYGFQDTEQGKWLKENSWRYGFVFRNQGVTDAIYKPWQLRYVGLTHAQIMWELGESLDEYLANLQEKEVYYVTLSGDAHMSLVIYYQTSMEGIHQTIKEVSGDNAGHYIITCYQ